MQKKNLLKVILFTTLFLLQAGLVTAFASLTPVRYLDDKSVSQNCTDYEEIKSGTKTWSGWYVVSGNVDIDGRVTVSDEVHLILTDGCKLLIRGGIAAGEGKSLTIYAQSTGENQGTLDCWYGVAFLYAAIGGGNNEAGGTITINGGKIRAKGGSNGAGIGGGNNGTGGMITINGGKITATGGNSGAAIGGGSNRGCGTITINGGKIDATGGWGGAGIGCGYNISGSSAGGATGSGITGGYTGGNGRISISGGKITATGGDYGAGIGGGYYGNGGKITISGGELTATGGQYGAGIGGGSNGAGGEITVSGGELTATGGQSGAGIGGGSNGVGGKITISGGTVTAKTRGGGAGIGGGYQGEGGKILLSGGKIKAYGDDTPAIGSCIRSYSDTEITIDLSEKESSIETEFKGYLINECYMGKVLINRPLVGWKNGEMENLIQSGELSDTAQLCNMVLKPAIGNLLTCAPSVRAEDDNRVGSTGYYLYQAGKTVTLRPAKGYGFVLDESQNAKVSVKKVTEYEAEYLQLISSGREQATFVMPAASVSAEAEIVANTYKVVFDKNAEAASGSMEEQEFVYNSPQKLLLNDFSYAGKTLVCWSENPDGSGNTWKNREMVENLTSENGASVTLYAQWRDATEWDSLQNEIDRATNGSVIKLEKDYTASEVNEDLSVDPGEGQQITIDLNGHIINRNGSYESCGIYAKSGKLTITDSAPDTVHTDLSYKDPIDQEKSVPIKGGALIGARHGVYCNHSEVVLEGGSIALHKGDGIYITGKGKCIMNGGAVCGNEDSGVYAGNGPFTMNGGVICANQRYGLALQGGSGTSTMNDGRISGNCGLSAGGIYVSYADFVMKGGTISGNYGQDAGGVYLDYATMTMQGGVITDNQASRGYGGVYAINTVFNVDGKVQICGNTAVAGEEAVESNLCVNATYGEGICLHIGDELDPGSRIGISDNAYSKDAYLNDFPTRFTSGLKKYGIEGVNVFFKDERLKYQLALYDGELVIANIVHTIGFDENGGSEVLAQQVPSANGVGAYVYDFDTDKAVALEPAMPERTGYEFTCWTLDGEPYDFSTAVTSDITLTAQWKKLLTNADISVPAIPDQEYTGKPVTPDITVLDKEEDITAKCDITYADNTDLGTAKITITAKAGDEDYKGSREVTFKIVKKEPAQEPGKEQGGESGKEQGKESGKDPGKDAGKDSGKDTAKDPAKGEKVQDAASKGTYEVISVGDAPTVTYTGSSVKDVTAATVPDEITINGKKYKVTEIAANAFKNNKKLKKITIGKNIQKIGKNAFFGCKNLKKVTIKTELLTKKTVGANAFRKIHEKAQFKVPKKKLKSYKTILKARGVKGKKQKIK